MPSFKITSTGLKHSKAQLTKIIQLGGFLDNMMSKLGRKALIVPAVPLAKYFLPKLASKTTFFVLDNVEKTKWTRSSKCADFIVSFS